MSDIMAADASKVADPVDMGMAPEMTERTVLRSFAAGWEKPAHRQTRPLPSPSQQRRRGDGSETELCQAESLITSYGQALVFRNLAALNTHMPFSAAINAPSTSGGGMGSADEQNVIIQSMLNTFGANIIMINLARNALNGNLDVLIDLPERAGKFSMPPSSFISQMVPLATFNRLDLAPSDDSVCGE